jgi:hypothetical protein
LDALLLDALLLDALLLDALLLDAFHLAAFIGVGTGIEPAPPSEPDVRISRIRLSG